MTLSEFKAWFDGFTESMDSTPNVKQWERIKARVAEIDNKPISYPVFIDRYVYPYSRPTPVWDSTRYWTSNTGLMQRTAGGAPEYAKVFNGVTAMLDLGKAEYREVA